MKTRRLPILVVSIGCMALYVFAAGTFLARAECPVEVKSEQKIAALMIPGVLLPGDLFGADTESLGLDPDGDGPIVQVLAVVAEFDDESGTNDGAIYILFLDDQGQVRDHEKITGFTADCEPTGDRCALVSVTWLGDLGVGAPTPMALATGAMGSEGGGDERGAAWILFLNDDFSLATEYSVEIDDADGLSLADHDRLGVGVAWLGDLGEGAPTPRALAVGAPGPGGGAPPPDSTGGTVWILFLNSDGTLSDWVKIAEGEGGFPLDVLAPADHFGLDVTALGDLDGDGVGDLAVGAVRTDDGGVSDCLLNDPVNCDLGAVWILFLNSDGTVRDQRKISATAEGFGGALDETDRLGSRLAWLGDLGVGSPTPYALGVGARFDDDGGTNHGAVWILFLDDSGMMRGHRKISSTEGGLVGPLDRWDQFAGVSWLGDLDGDGVSDIAVGAAGDDEGGLGPCLTRPIPNCDLGAVWILFLNAPLSLIVEEDSLLWQPPADASGYDLVRGDLDTLRSTAGDFTAATVECLAANHADPHLSFAVPPDPGEGFWFLTRRRTTTGVESYDACGPSQAESRDLEIAISGASCL